MKGTSVVLGMIDVFLFHNKIPVCSTCGKGMTKRDVIIEGLSEIDTGYTAVGSAKRMQFQGK